MTILCNKFDGTPKGFAYIEFADKDSVETAMALDESLFRGRQIKVSSPTRSLASLESFPALTVAASCVIDFQRAL